MHHYVQTAEIHGFYEQLQKHKQVKRKEKNFDRMFAKRCENINARFKPSKCPFNTKLSIKLQNSASRNLSNAFANGMLESW